MFNEPKVEPPKTLWPQCMAGLTATIGGLILGSCIGWSGPAIPMLKNSNITDFSVTKTECNFVASLMPGGALFGGEYIYFSCLEKLQLPVLTKKSLVLICQP